MSTATYDPSQIVVTLGGNVLTGFGPEQFLSVKRDEASFTDEAGVDGEVVRVRKHDKRATVELTLMQSSSSNDVLAASLEVDETIGSGVGAFMVKDLNGTTLLSSANAWVSKQPDGDFGKDATARVWTIRCERLVGKIGGIRRP